MQLCNKCLMQPYKLHHLDIHVYGPELIFIVVRCDCSIYCSLGTSYSATFMFNYQHEK